MALIIVFYVRNLEAKKSHEEAYWDVDLLLLSWLEGGYLETEGRGNQSEDVCPWLSV